MYNYANEKQQWSQETWNHIHQLVHTEIKAGVAMQVFPLCMVAPTTTVVPAAIINLQTGGADEAQCAPLVDIEGNFPLTEQQAYGPENSSTVDSIVTFAAKLVRLAIDGFNFQGPSISANPLFQRVSFRNGSAIVGLLDAITQVVQVQPISQNPKRYGEDTYDGVADATSILANNGYEGSNVLVLPTEVYNDANRLPTGDLITPLARLKELATEGVYPSAMVSPSQILNQPTPSKGFLMSKGLGAVELVVGIGGKTELVQMTTAGDLFFRIVWRGIHIVRDPQSLVRLEFE